MNTSHAVLVTGAGGGIGTALTEAYRAAGWRVIATDQPDAQVSAAHVFLPANLEAIAMDDGARDIFCDAIRKALGGATLCALVNNAALQILGSLHAISLTDWERTLRVNITAPFRLAQGLLAELRTANGVVINIGSVHAQATKREFISYATSKAAIHGLTRAMAVDLGETPRVLCVAPAAVDTPMLRAGFEGQPSALAALAAAHPAGRIATAAEIARAVVVLSQEPFLYATGSTIWLDGGILSRLYDPA
ncbi:SDR family NAD(P)-dependent oxidoreductase [Rhizorhapis sp. SPR117]|uniref:SDR family NAD(P)-dependent oxidoreductase n=1 Tax=Rhizorhapis sp. SPR117 TaxID=2912611 RepID=UPI001F2B5BCB|nr:SDR family oxidoreductase [Rhizorhapis sp. SPR117]